MQLVAYGAQDVYLTGSPQITFFKLVYRRHTNFAVESIEQTFNGSPGFGKKASATISRNGDLVTSVWLQVTVPQVSSGGQCKDKFMHRFLENCEIEIGGQRIDKHYSQFYEVCDQLMCPAEKKAGYLAMVGMSGKASNGTDTYTTLATNMAKHAATTFYMPLRFWFNSNPGLALPLIALQYHEVKLQMSFGKAADCLSAGSADPTVSLWVDYVYLDTDERRRFAQASHEYLIEQLQYTGDESLSLSSTDTSTKVRLNFNHPTKELIWFVHSDTDPLEFGESVVAKSDGTSNGTDITGYEYVKDAKLLLNGHDRFAKRPGSYFRLVVPFQSHTNVPTKHIYCYSFALKPEEHQPSGSCNFSRIDNASLHLTLNKSSQYKATDAGDTYQWVGVDDNDYTTNKVDENVKLSVYALSYNILRIVSGMGGLAYSN